MTEKSQLPFQGLTVFVGGPFSAALKFESGQIVGFDEKLRSRFAQVHDFFVSRGARIFSSHLAEKFGSDVHEGTLVQRDNSWLLASDVYVAFLPLGDAGPYRTDGTFVEIGLALGSATPCALLIEDGQSPQWSYYVRNLGRETNIAVIDYAAGECAWERNLTEFVSSGRVAMKRSRHIADPAVLHSVLSGVPDGYSVALPGAPLYLPTGVTSSRFDHSIGETAALLQGRISPGSTFLGVGAGSAELCAIAADAGASHVELVEPDAALAERISRALRARGALLNHVSTFDAPKRAQLADVVVACLPPIAGTESGGPFAVVRKALLRQLNTAAGRLRSRGLLFVTSAAVAPSDDIMAAVNPLGLKLERALGSVGVESNGAFGVWKATAP